MLNSCNFIGHIGNVEERNINQDRKAVKFSLAVSGKWKDRNGDWQEKPTGLKSLALCQANTKIAIEKAI
jgi:single-stranded DNA-binding protein